MNNAITALIFVNNVVTQPGVKLARISLNVSRTMAWFLYSLFSMIAVLFNIDTNGCTEETRLNQREKMIRSFSTYRFFEHICMDVLYQFTRAIISSRIFGEKVRANTKKTLIIMSMTLAPALAQYFMQTDIRAPNKEKITKIWCYQNGNFPNHFRHLSLDQKGDFVTPTLFFTRFTDYNEKFHWNLIDIIHLRCQDYVIALSSTHH